MGKKKQQLSCTALAKIGILAIIFFLIILIIISFYVFYESTHPDKVISQETPLKYGYKYIDIEFYNADNIKLKGWFIPAKDITTNKAIICLHGYPFDKGDILNQTLFLSKDYNLLLFDFRYFGLSEGKYTTIGLKEQNDVLGAVKYLQSNGYDKIGVLGFSMGGSTALMAAEKNKDIKAVVTDSAFANLDIMFRKEKFDEIPFKNLFLFTTRLISKLLVGLNPKDVSPMDSVKNYDTPILIIHSESDDYISVDNAYLISNNARNPELWIIKNKNAKHGLEYNAVKEEYESRVLEFFKKRV